MKRLFYTTADIDDAERISAEVHATGIDDQHFYAINRNDDELKKHHLHGGTSIEKSRLIAGRRKSGIIAALALVITITFLAINTGVSEQGQAVPVALILVLSTLIVFVVSMVGASFDQYFLTLFNRYIDAGETLLIIDVNNNQMAAVKQVLEHHPKAHFIADCSSYGAPIPD